MRPIELTCALLTLFAAACIILSLSMRVVRWAAGCALIAAVLQVVVEGPHWQIFAEYAAVGVICAASLTRDWTRGALRTIAFAAIAFDGAAMVASSLLPVFNLPRPTGPYEVGTTTLYMTDDSRREDAVHGSSEPRRLKVQLWYPAKEGKEKPAPYRDVRETEALSRYQHLVLTHSATDAPVAQAQSPFPLILFSPGWASRRTIATYLTEDLASHGYVVAAIDHPYNAKIVAFADGDVVRSSAVPDIDFGRSTPEGIKAIWNKELLKWEVDEQFVLDRLEEMSNNSQSPWFHRIDAENVGAIGHSFGGAAAAGLCAHDPRVHAAVNMDGWYFDAIEARGANQPLLAMATGDSAVIDDRSTAVVDRLQASDGRDLLASLRKYGGYRVILNGAKHNDFTDEALVSPLDRLSYRGTIPASELQRVVRSYVLAFFNKTLRGKDSELLNGSASPFKQVSFEVWTPAGETRDMAILGRITTH